MIGGVKQTKNTPQRGNSYELYDRLSKQMVKVLENQVTNIKQLTNLIWLVGAVIQGNTIALSQLATYLPGDAQAESRVTRVRRWLMNAHIEAWELYRPLLQQVMKGWTATTLTVIVDGTMVFGDRLQVFCLSLAHGNRAIPLWWVVVPG